MPQKGEKKVIYTPFRSKAGMLEEENTEEILFGGTI